MRASALSFLKGFHTHTGPHTMTTESNRQFVNFLFDKLLTTVDTDLIDTLDDDGVDNDHEWRKLVLEWES